MSRDTIDKRKLIIALGVLLLVVAAAFGFSLTRMDDTPAAKAAAEAAEEEQEAIEDACASRTTFQGLKQLVFDQAGRARTGERANFDILASSAFVRMENPVVASNDEGLELTRCTGSFILELPPGAEAAFNGERRLTAEVQYEVQAAADGSGPVYRLSGAEAIVARLAAFDMQGVRLPPAEADATADPFANQFEPLPPPEIESPAEIPPSPLASPSFDCRDARTRGEVMVCASGGLAAQDRAMAALYGAAIEDGDRRTRRRLERTRDSFLAYRDRCGSEACVADAYQGRMQEIRDIMVER